MKCRYCGANNPKSGILCVKCGRKVEGSISPVSLQRPEKLQNTGNKTKKTVKKQAGSIPPPGKTVRIERKNLPLSKLVSPEEQESPKPRSSSSWDIYPRSGSYFVLDMAKDLESGGKEEEEEK